MEVKFKPLGKRVLVQPDKPKEKTESGIFIPDSAKEVPKVGVIVSVGRGTKDYSMESKVGDRVMFGKYSGIEVELSEEKYLLMNEEELLGII